MNMTHSSWSFASVETGVFERGHTVIPAECDPTEYAPAGCVPVEGKHDWTRVRFDNTSGKVVPYQPPAPAEDEWQTWAWDADAWCWRSVPTTAALARDARAERARRIEAVAMRYERNAREVRMGLPITDSLEALDTYVQALADLPATPGFPTNISWPRAPA